MSVAVEFQATELTPIRKIRLSSKLNIFCIVDAQDYNWLLNWKGYSTVWNFGHNGTQTQPKKYAKCNLGKARQTIWMHRVIMMRAEPKPDWFYAVRMVDHINGQTLDNRRCNLRWVTAKGNRRNHVRHPPSLQWIIDNFCTDEGDNEEIPF